MKRVSEYEFCMEPWRNVFIILSLKFTRLRDSEGNVFAVFQKDKNKKDIFILSVEKFVINSSSAAALSLGFKEMEGLQSLGEGGLHSGQQPFTL